jgi:uncharacterized protein (DUF2236 family)
MRGAGPQREIVLLLAWGPAILLQLAHPLVARGVADHSAFRTERWGATRRLHRTVGAMLRLCFGTGPEAGVAAARINAIHDRVQGRLPDAAGVFSAGTPYSAHDPALLAWVHATLLDMNLRVHELFVAPLPPAATDRYCAEACAIEDPLGIPRGLLPRSGDELRRYLDRMLASGEICVTDPARTLARSIVEPALPFVPRPLLGLARLTTVGLLPPPIRRDYGFSWSPRREAALQRWGAALRLLLPLVPSRVRHWPAARAADRRGCPVAARQQG